MLISNATTKSHRSSPSESIDESLSISNDKMWRNELPQNDGDSSKQQDRPQGISRLSNLVDIALRIFLVIGFFKLETMSAFQRQIHAEELWLYKNPRRPDIVKADELLLSVIAVPFIVTCIYYLFTKDRKDFRSASWAWTLALCMNGIPTSLLKITVGRPRPDFYYRCFPDGVMVLNERTNSLGSSLLDFNCTGSLSDINEGRKSFPSGHSSFAFASFGFVAYYVGAKLHAFDPRGRGNTWRLYLAVVPLFVAALVAVSRTCDYHHHWQDVTVGALIGLFSGYYSYRQYYPSIFSPNADRPLPRPPQHKETFSKPETLDDASRAPLLDEEQTKWH
ncbi:phospholipid phosphatase 5 isoform X2 [Drosophila busckii]|nr:phospholipid phosphatase 5 isoform X2 [Drosophila busckii]XP_017849761.1 phospholipid phosphatase 5 isoform X2 [Drosophila busckii]